MKRAIGAFILIVASVTPVFATDTVDAGNASTVTDKYDGGSASAPAVAMVYDGANAGQVASAAAASAATMSASFR